MAGLQERLDEFNRPPLRRTAGQGKAAAAIVFAGSKGVAEP